MKCINLTFSWISHVNVAQLHYRLTTIEFYWFFIQKICRVGWFFIFQNVNRLFICVLGRRIKMGFQPESFGIQFDILSIDLSRSLCVFVRLIIALHRIYISISLIGDMRCCFFFSFSVLHFSRTYGMVRSMWMRTQIFDWLVIRVLFSFYSKLVINHWLIVNIRWHQFTLCSYYLNGLLYEIYQIPITDRARPTHSLCYETK